MELAHQCNYLLKKNGIMVRKKLLYGSVYPFPFIEMHFIF